MIAAIIAGAVRQRGLVILLTLAVVALGLMSLRQLNVDAIPDLSDVQVIVKTSYPGQSPDVVEQQVTYPLSRAMMSVPKASVVRGYSFVGDAYVYIIFEDGTDPYWARARVMESLAQIQSSLPEGAVTELGPDASGVGWVYQYALLDRTGKHNLAELKSLQDWFLQPELLAIDGIAEVATVGGMTQTFQVVVDPLKMAAYGLDIEKVRAAIISANGETGGSVIEQGEAEYLIRAKGYLTRIEQFEELPIGATNQAGQTLTLEDIATIRLGPGMRRGIAELNGEGEVVGGIIVMRSGENARQIIASVKQRLAELTAGLPAGVEVVTVYDRSQFIQASVDNLTDKLIQELMLVSAVLILFLLHIRSTLIAIVVLPLSIIASLMVMSWLGISANIMSLGGIAIAIGALVDAAIVMIENQHKHLQRFIQKHQRKPQADEQWQLVIESCSQVGPALFWTLLLITVSFLPVFALAGQEGRLFTPLALTKSLAMAAAALLAITLVPVLLGYGVRGKVIAEQRHPLVRAMTALYRPMLGFSLRTPWLSLLLLVAISASAWYPWQRMGSEFMPQINEGSLLYMPTTLPSVSAAKAAEILQQTDRLIKTIPEVDTVFGKVGRAETATDPAPLTMLETTITLKPQSQWREGISMEDIIEQLQATVDVPGITNAWVQPIKTRIDMLSTGIKTPLGIKISGPDPTVIEQIGQQVEQALAALETTRSVYAERTAQGRYIDIEPNLQALARIQMTQAQLHQVVALAIGGASIDTVIDGQTRYPVNVRYPRRWRDDIQKLRDLPVVGPAGAYVPLSSLATISMSSGPAMLKSENARLTGWVFIEPDNITSSEYIEQARVALAEIALPAQYSLTWSGQYESMQRVEEQLTLLVPLTLLVCLILLYATLKNWWQALIIMLTLPAALAGALWLLWWLGYALSVAVAVGMIALAGVAAEFGVVMYLYLNQAWNEQTERNITTLQEAVIKGAVERIRPKVMTVATIVLSLLPLLFSTGAGHEVMSRIAAPMLGGMIVAPIISLFVIPVVFYVTERRRIRLR